MKQRPYFLREEVLEELEDKPILLEIYEVADMLTNTVRPERIYAILEAFRRHVRGD